MPRIIASVEARMGSSRFPGKVLSDVQGVPALTRQMRRLRKSRLIDDIVLATTTDKKDDVLESWAQDLGIECYRGSEEDVLNRVMQAHQKMRSDIVVEITGDCTLQDPCIVDLAIMTFLENDCDVVTNTCKRSFPIGQDIQVFPLKKLEWVEKNISDPVVREHVSIYFYENPDKYRLLHLFAPERWSAPDYRMTLDYPEDLEFINKIYQYLEAAFSDDFGLEEIMALLKKRPELVEINRHCVHRNAR
jgi:spore coat polysaccharide biosynthesis protein SpsF